MYKKISDINLKSLGYECELVEIMKKNEGEEFFYCGEEAIVVCKGAVSNMDKRLIDIFHEKDLPVISPGVRSSPGGNYYMSPSIDGKRPGIYYLT